MTEKPFSAFRAAARWWRSRSLAGQLVLTNLAVVAIWAVTTRQVIALQDARRADAEQAAADAGAAVLVTARIDPILANLSTDQRGFALTGDSSFLGPYRLGRIQLDVAMDSLSQLAKGNEDLTFATDRLDRAALSWGRAATRQFAAQSRDVPEDTAVALAHRVIVLMDSARAATAMLERVTRAQAERRAREAARQIEVDSRESLLVRLLLVAMIVLATVASLRRVTGTLDAIVFDARALAAGDHRAAVRSVAGGSRELGQLGEAFGTLAAAVAERELGLRDDIRQLKEVERLKTEFVSTVSHELRTPLTAIRGALGLVLAGTTGVVASKTRDLLQIGLQNTERLIRLINDILDVERIESGHLSVRREPCELAEILRSTVESLRTVTMETHVSLVIEADESAVVTGDPDRLVQVFTNLISNAVRFSPRGESVTVTLRTTPTSAVVFVSDRGPGIPLEFRKRIFGKFQQADPAGASGGAGLGLAIVRAIVERHGGSIRFDSAPGHGTTFITELPYTAPSASETPANAADHRLLLVDDDRDMLSILRSLCETVGAVTAVGSPEEAWRALTSAPYDAIVIDPSSPGSRGIDLVFRLRELPVYADVPVLVFSAREFSDKELDGITLAPSHAFVKARDREQDLVLRLKAVLAVRRPRRAIAIPA
ncbi:MAG TPA: ATP-binding protein [Gemmatimonadaceae bacterium]|nr:ATP-binding protein [Gemmatimonadaceae bacterium]